MSLASIYAMHRLTDCSQQSLAIERFAKEPIALGDRSLLVCYLVTPSDEDHLLFWPRLPDQLGQFEAVHCRHADVGNQAVDLCESGFVLQERSGGAERPNRIAGRLEQIP